MLKHLLSPPKYSQAEPASFILESVIAASAAITTLAIIAPMFAQQIELSRRARDTDLVEAAATKDVNAIRQYARYWRMRSGPYSSTYLTNTVTGFTYTQRQSNAIAYVPNDRSECLTKDSYLINFLADLKNFPAANIEIVNYPRQFNVARDITPPGLAGRYLLTRNFQRLQTDSMVPTIRMTYLLTPLNNSPALAFGRTAELQLEMHNGC